MVTIIIPTYNRPLYALRNMTFWSDKFAKVIVLDGSESPLSNQTLSSLSSNIVYIHKIAPWNVRVLLAAEMITTSYAMLCCDDDFMLPCGIVDCIKFLESNLDYASCTGRIIGFEPKDGGLRLWPEKAHHKSHIVSHDSFDERIKFHLGNFNITTLYGVHRTESLNYCLKCSLNYTYSSPYVLETFFELLSAAFGKSSVLSVPSRLSSQENLPITNSEWNRSIYISDWYDDLSKEDEVRYFYYTALEALNSLNGPAKNMFNEKILRMAIEARINISRNHTQRVSRVTKINFMNWFRGTDIFRILRLLYRLMALKGTDYNDDYFYSKSKYKFNQLKVEHGIKINSLAEKELIEIFNMVLKLRAGIVLPAAE